MATKESKQSKLPGEKEPVDDQRVDAGLNGKVHYKTLQRVWKRNRMGLKDGDLKRIDNLD